MVKGTEEMKAGRENGKLEKGVGKGERGRKRQRGLDENRKEEYRRGKKRETGTWKNHGNWF